MFHILLSLSFSCLLSWIIFQKLPSKIVARCCQLATAIINNTEQYSSARSLLASNFYLLSEEIAISAANYNYNHYNLPFSHIMIILITSDEDMLLILCIKLNRPFSNKPAFLLQINLLRFWLINPPVTKFNFLEETFRCFFILKLLL